MPLCAALGNPVIQSSLSYSTSSLPVGSGWTSSSYSSPIHMKFYGKKIDVRNSKCRWQNVVLNGFTVSEVELFEGGYKFKCAPNNFAFVRPYPCNPSPKVQAHCRMPEIEGVYIAYRCDSADAIIRDVVTRWRLMSGPSGRPRALGIDTEGSGYHLGSNGVGMDKTRKGPSVVQIACGNVVLVISVREYVADANTNYFPQLLEDILCDESFVKVYTGDPGQGKKTFDAMGLRNQYVAKQFMNLRSGPSDRGGCGFAEHLGFYFCMKKKMFKNKKNGFVKLDEEVKYQVDYFKARVSDSKDLCREDFFFVHGHSVSFYPSDDEESDLYLCEWRNLYLRLEKCVYAALDAAVSYYYYYSN